MVAKIISGKNLRGLLLYNEQKVTEGSASLIMASRFGTEVGELNLKAKLTRFQHLTELNTRVKTNALHIILNFDRNDKLNTPTFQQIAARYMERIGFGEQPYLVYRHRDASHPHIHIVTTNIQPDGKRIDIHGIGRTVSENARKELENEFKLTKAEGRGRSEELHIRPIPLEKADYGKTPTKRAIQNVVSQVFRSYRFTSLAEYKAALNEFNVTCDRGKEDTIMFQKRGLVYSIIDPAGNRIGIPFKASALAGRPTLDKLERTFVRNKEKRVPYKTSLKQRIDAVQKKYYELTKATLIGELRKQQIAVLFRANAEGRIYGVTFVDHRHRTVFNGSDLGKGYSANALMTGIGNRDRLKSPEKESFLNQQIVRNAPSVFQTRDEKEAVPDVTLDLTPSTRYLDALMKQEPTHQQPYPSRRKKRKRKRGQQVEIEQGINHS